jgi:hypothetical protein
MWMQRNARGRETPHALAPLGPTFVAISRLYRQNLRDRVRIFAEPPWLRQGGAK